MQRWSCHGNLALANESQKVQARAQAAVAARQSCNASLLMMRSVLRNKMALNAERIVDEGVNR